MSSSHKLLLGNILLVCILVCLSNSPLWARGGGGCLIEGTYINTPNGETSIENLKQGDYILSWNGTQIIPTKVIQLIKVNTDECVEITTPQSIIKATSEHLFFTNNYELKRVSDILTQDSLLLVTDKSISLIPVLAIKNVTGYHSAYNLIVESPGTFLTHNIAVHNKGCFLPDTEILLSDGRKIPISQVKAGDKLLAFTLEGEIISAPVKEIVSLQSDKYYEIITDKTILNVTPEHPLYTGNKTFRLAESVNIGDHIFIFDGKQLSDEIIRIKQVVNSPCLVYNLRTDYPNTFFANNIAVHNKGGGCFLSDTKILSSDGNEIPIQNVKSGDNILALRPDGNIIPAKVRNTLTLKTNEYYEIVTDRTILRVTPEHPFLISEQTFKPIKELSEGNTILVFNDNKLVSEFIRNKRLIQDNVIVYNLQTDYPNTFFANRVAVHNKGGGCFPAGTMISTPNGIKPIESIQIGDTVLGVNKNRLIPVKVQKVYSTISELIEIRTEDTIIHTTAEHPLLKMDGEFGLAGALKNEESLCIYHNNTFSHSKILSVKQILGLVPVYNIEVDSPHTFIADNIVVHNKGGFGGRGGGGGGETPPGWVMFVFFGVVFVIVIVGLLRKGKDENLDYCYPLNKIQPKTGKTNKLLAFLSKQDPTLSSDLLKKISRDAFEKLQQCWQARAYEPMMPLMMTDLYKEHLRQIESMKRNHEINMIAGLTIDFVEIVNIRYYEKKDKREFTALIQAKSRDYYIDDQTNDFIRGDSTPATFQEFWTFQSDGTNWLVRQIEQTKESDVLSERNFVEMFTDEQLRQIYRESVSKDTGPIGPALDEEIKIRDDKIHRHLNFLVQTDKIWDENEMKETSRDTFINLYLTRESSSIEKIQSLLFPEIINSLQGEIDQRKNRGEVIEFRNLCVRKVDIVLIRNFTDNTKDEFTVRITAHAQKVFKRNNLLISQDTYVSPFEQYWTFGRKDNQWLLKEILPSANVLKYKPDIDEDVSKEQMEWYHSKDRAL